ncbi:Tannase/feruloyl esterase [Aspergillus californicus]
MFSKSYTVVLTALLAGACSALECSPTAIDKPDVLGATILDIQASEVLNYTTTGRGPSTDDGGQVTISFCNVTVVHTHPGWGDKIRTQVWLPLDNWNGRFQGLGGGGFAVGLDSFYLPYAVAGGFASASTDGGHTEGDSLIMVDLSWTLSSRNNINWPLLENFGSKALGDMAEIGKQITKSYYQKPAAYSYFNGCSEGGRQGLAVAQAFPDAFDGILAVAPSINVQSFLPSGYWPTQVMNQQHIYPSACEAKGFVDAAVNACDTLDGVKDGIISLPSACKVTAHDFIGQKYTCNGTRHTLTASGAKVVQAAWSGTGEDGYFGVNKDADITFVYIQSPCDSNIECANSTNILFRTWIQHLVAKDPDFDIIGMTDAEFFNALRYSKANYEDMLGANNPDLSLFRASGGKMVTWVGLADQNIPPEGIIRYYQEVLEKDSKAHDFYRLFEAPGVAHCFGGLGPIPNGALNQLMDWVEKDVAPDTLHAINGNNNTSRDLCPYPLQQRYTGGDPRKAESFTCAKP